MSITTYAQLKSSIADWLNRDDLTAVIPSFISLAEAEVSRDLRHWLQEKRVTTSLNEEFEYLPDDWLETISLRLNRGDELSIISQSEMAEYKEGTADVSGTPKYYCISAGQMEFYPVPDVSYDVTLTYHARIPAMVNDTDTNWLLTNQPDIMLYASLKHAAPYLDDDRRLGVWKQLYDQAIQRLEVNSDLAKHSGPLVMRFKAI